MRLLVCLCALLFVYPIAVIAQFTDISQDISLAPSPRYPEPGTTVRVELRDFALGDASREIRWILDGQVVANAQNQRSLTFTAGEIGVTHTIDAMITLVSGQTVTVSETVTTSRITVIIEPLTTAPDWYRGRPLPSVGSRVRVIAIPQTGSEVNPQDFAYTWRLNNAVNNQGAVLGQYQNVLTMPFGRETVLTVDVSDRSGTVVGQRSVVIPNVEPELYFYEVNPLRGQHVLAIDRTLPLLGGETTVKAEPFHISQDVYSGEVLYEWKVDGRTMVNPNQDQRLITLQNGGGTGRFNVEFHMRNLRALLQGVKEDFVVTF